MDIKTFFLLLATIILGITACKNDDEILTDSAAKLEFSLDTLMFDTVFTEIGSATRILKLYNRNAQPIEIQSINIEKGSSSKFRINIDGEPTNSAEAIKVPAEDSLYIFGEVTVDPNQPLSESPFVINDAIVFVTNGNTQKVVLEAWGQNANYFPDRFSADSINIYGCGGAEFVFDDPKPYVIYGIVAFDDCQLIMPAGTEVYFHGGLTRQIDQDGNTFFYNDGRLVIGPSASLVTQGTFEEPVVLQGDRLEQSFDEVPGQWYGVILNPGSTGNSFTHTVIKNSVLGVVVDSSAALTLSKTQISNTTANGIFARAATITAENCLFYDNGATAIRTSLGGNYQFDYCTVGAFGNDQQSLFLTNVQCLDQFCTNFYINELNAQMRNCIFFGSNSDQIALDPTDLIDFNYNFENCILRVDDLLMPDNFPNFLDNTTATINADRDAVIFADENGDDYHLDTLSIAEDMALLIPSLEIDLDLEMRDPVNPDIGCYEYQYD